MNWLYTQHRVSPFVFLLFLLWLIFLFLINNSLVYNVQLSNPRLMCPFVPYVVEFFCF
ncbi:MAG: hypothetical protein JWP12_3048 [Bacteroidetes bacterium]|nr:hypothetical protein [Bacteroidota bacterium]